MRTRVLAVAIAAFLLCAGGAVSAISWASAQKLVHPAREASTATPSDAGLAFERVWFDASDGIGLVGWWMPSSAARGVVIFLHGYGDSKDQSLPLAPFLHRAGYHVLAFDFRAHGESGGDHTTVGLDEVRDVHAAIDFARRRAPEASEGLALVGFSMGAAAALNAAPTSPEVDAIVADSAFATLANVASNSISHFSDLPKYPFGPLSVAFASWIVGKDVAENAPLRAVRDAEAPILVIQGAADVIAFPDEDGRAIAAAAPAGSALWLVEGAAHVESHWRHRTAYEARVLKFLDENLSSA